MKCAVCGNGYKTEKARKAHMREKHKKDAPYKQEDFSQKSTISRKREKKEVMKVVQANSILDIDFEQMISHPVTPPPLTPSKAQHRTVKQQSKADHMEKCTDEISEFLVSAHKAKAQKNSPVVSTTTVSVTPDSTKTPIIEV